jgi:UDP-N-acetylglucosamine/UDP-N-acetylgalactosamine diphosphorylase
MLAKLEKKLEEIDQQQLLSFWSQLNENERRTLQHDIESLKTDRIIKLGKILSEKDEQEHLYQPGNFEPADVDTLPGTAQEKEQRWTAARVGEKAIKEGTIGAILVAGGQGTRLGFHGPKGVFPVGPVTDKSLYQYFLERLLALERRYSTRIPLYVMTSENNHHETKEFFLEHDYFGKERNSVVFFQQGMLPTFDENGKIFLEEKYKISKAPDGHGGLLNALKENNLFEDMKNRGLENLFYFQVDNVLVQICDPAFIGIHLQKDADLSAKTVYKSDPFEKLGNIGIINDTYVTVEYTELSEEEKKARDEEGKLVFGQGSIAIHVFSRKFLQRFAGDELELPYHIAHKKIIHIDESGKKIEPDNPNGYKLEQFIFDTFPIAERVVVMETEREKDFSPIKNAEGTDSPQTARQHLNNYFGSWLERAGYELERDQEGNVQHQIEVSPLYALDEEEFISKIPKDLQIKDKMIFE